MAQKSPTVESSSIVNKPEPTNLPLNREKASSPTP